MRRDRQFGKYARLFHTHESAEQRGIHSYAPKDGAQLPHRLQADFTAKGFDAWLDTRRIAGGATWTQEIEQALDACPVALALLTPGSYASEICRAEQLRALRNGKRVIPLLARSGSDIPLHLETKNYRDFTRRQALRPTAQALDRRHAAEKECCSAASSVSRSVGCQVSEKGSIDLKGFPARDVRMDENACHCS